MTASCIAPIGRRHYAGIFLLCLGTLLLELSLTRVMSVALWYHFGFLVVSTALLGFGTSGVTLALWRRLREEIPLDRALATLALLFGVLTIEKGSNRRFETEIRVLRRRQLPGSVSA